MRQGRDAEASIEGEECTWTAGQGEQPKAIFFAFEACKMSHLVMLNVTVVARVNWSFSELVKCSNYITA